MNKVLVTGANGFVGNILCKTLRSQNINFVPVVRKAVCDGQFSIGHFNAKTDWGNALSGCDVVIHLAARVHVMNDKSANPLAVFREINCDATLNLAKQAVLNGVKRFVFVSSIKVNGERTTKKPFTAFDKALPHDPYGQSKLEAENALKELSQETGLEVVIIRPPLVYGPGVRANFLQLMQLVKMGVPLPLGAIRNLRSMVSVENLVDLLITCSVHPKAAGHTFLVSDDRDISISELLRILFIAMGKRPLLIPVSPRIIAIIAMLFGKSAVAGRLLDSLQVDISYTKSVLGWKPKLTMEDSIKKTVAHFLGSS